MFSGIIEAIGQIQKIDVATEGASCQDGHVFWIESELPLNEVKIGDSIAIDGCCLTVLQVRDQQFEVFLSHETMACTTFQNAKVGTQVNLERALALGARLDGHMVQGHVECVGILKSLKPMDDSVEITLELPKSLKGFVITKGSIAIDGISLTTNRLQDQAEGQTLVGINLIPHTLKETTLGRKPVGSGVHVETDLIGRYVHRMLDVFGKEGSK